MLDTELPCKNITSLELSHFKEEGIEGKKGYM